MRHSVFVFSRVIWIVLDSVGIGAMPDAAAYGDAGSDTLGNIVRGRRGIQLPNLCAMGLGNLKPLDGLPAAPPSHGRLRPLRAGFARQRHHHRAIGRWPESISTRPFPLFPHGFPPEVLQEFERRTGRSVIGNSAASGTEIIGGTGRRAHADRFAHRLHIRRQRLPDRRA